MGKRVQECNWILDMSLYILVDLKPVQIRVPKAKVWFVQPLGVALDAGVEVTSFVPSCLTSTVWADLPRGQSQIYPLTRYQAKHQLLQESLLEPRISLLVQLLLPDKTDSLPGSYFSPTGGGHLVEST
jgi:hypothetical protein